MSLPVEEHEIVASSADSGRDSSTGGTAVATSEEKRAHRKNGGDKSERARRSSLLERIVGDRLVVLGAPPEPEVNDSLPLATITTPAKSIGESAELLVTISREGIEVASPEDQPLSQRLRQHRRRR